MLEPLSVAGPIINVKMANIQVELNGNVAIPCVAQGFPVPDIR